MDGEQVENATPRFGRDRQDFRSARELIAHVAQLLDEQAGRIGFGLDEPSAEAAGELRSILEHCIDPGEYRVAVIGRFKVGKSSFVNEILGQRLAGVNTHPETAAVTTFRSGPEVLARVTLVERAYWKASKVAFQADDTDPEARRIRNWFARRTTKDDKPYDEAALETLERELLDRPDRTVILMPPSIAAQPDHRKGLNEFLRKVQLYTTSTNPHHCLVESIEIETPSEVLAEGIVLIDTPGLDDTERFRVQLTERAVEDVDTVLFLTKSGDAYGQGEKEFPLSLLRRGTVRQLLVIVTQVDATLEKARRDARNNDVDPEPAHDLIAREARRIRADLNATLDEVAAEASEEAVTRYREQLDAIDIRFVSARNH